MVRPLARWASVCLLTCAATSLPAATLEEPLRLVMPLACEVGRTCLIQNYVDHGSPAGARDYQCGTITYQGHNGTDIRLPTVAVQRAGVDVLAAADGEVLRFRDGVPDRSVPTIAPPQADGRECGNGIIVSHRDEWQTQYCHLAERSVRVTSGERVVAGQPIGRVGMSGLTEFPHLHLTVRHKGEIVDPFAYAKPKDACGGGTSLWSASLQASLAYRPRAILNSGFAAKPVTMAMIELGEADEGPRRADAEVLVAFVRAIGLKAGDVQRLSIRAPDRKIIAEHKTEPLDRDKAQWMMFAGGRRPPAGWAAGTYTATYDVRHDGAVVLDQTFALTF